MTAILRKKTGRTKGDFLISGARRFNIPPF